MRCVCLMIIYHCLILFEQGGSTHKLRWTKVAFNLTPFCEIGSNCVCTYCYADSSRESKRIVLLFRTRMSRVTITVRPNPDPMNSGKCHRDETIFAFRVLRVECAIFILLSVPVFITRSSRIDEILFDFRFLNWICVMFLLPFIFCWHQFVGYWFSVSDFIFFC